MLQLSTCSLEYRHMSQNTSERWLLHFFFPSDIGLLTIRQTKKICRTKQQLTKQHSILEKDNVKGKCEAAKRGEEESQRVTEMKVTKSRACIRTRRKRITKKLLCRWLLGDVYHRERNSFSALKDSVVCRAATPPKRNSSLRGFEC